MAILGQTCDCPILYGVREAQFRALDADGSVNEAGDFYATDCPISIGFEPEVEEGNRAILKCGDKEKNVLQEPDNLTGATISFEMGCDNAEIQYIIGGSVGTVTYDTSSPPCAIGYCPPTLDEQANAVDFEVRFYQAVYDGSNVTGYREWHFYQVKPAYQSYSGAQEEYSTPSWTMNAVEATMYDADGNPVYCKTIVDAIPS